MKHQVMDYSVENPRKIFTGVALLVLIASLFIPGINIDTDPENMLPTSSPARVIHEEVKHRFGLADMIVLGVVNDSHQQGIYNPSTLKNLHSLSSEIANIDGVISDDMMSLQTTDNISQKGPGEISFHWMMERPPATQEQANSIASAVSRLPMIQNTLVSGDNRAAGIYIPIEAKDQSYRISQEISVLIDALDKGEDQFHITGLPVAEDTFGVEMFKQMAISAPAAGLLIFLLMLFFFRSVPLVIAPMIVAMSTVLITMGGLIGMGFPVHIMSSMIPIFLMPVAVVDSVHLLSEFSDSYRPGDNKKQLAKEVVNDLFQPMLFTSVTSMVGFASLNTADIPPVQVFGSFIALGIGVAFVLSITLVPAYMANLSDETLEKMAKRVHGENNANVLDRDLENSSLESRGLLSRSLRLIPTFSISMSKIIILFVVALFVVSGWGISRIVINDNPVNWFEKEHPIRVADQVLNKHFAGTYEAFLSFDYEASFETDSFIAHSEDLISDASETVKSTWSNILEQNNDGGALGFDDVYIAITDMQFEADDLDINYWDALADETDKVITKQKYFLQPENLAYIEKAQQALMASGLVGKTSGLPDLLKTVNRELQGGKEENYKLPENANAAAQAILTYQGSHRPNDVWHMVTPDYHSSIIWLQLKSGDNRDMSAVVKYMDNWFVSNPLPKNLKSNWSGLTYINVVWQDAMVSGMLKSLLSSFVVVALMMMFLFRSVLWGLIAMLPLSITITFIYSLIGFTGKNYDMPIAVLSALTLGMSIDFAIHFIERTRALVAEKGSWELGIKEVFEEPGRAISRNAIVIALGFTPLLFAPLVPYQTVGVFLATIMAVSCLTTLVVLPGIIHLLRHILFKGLEAPKLT